MNEELMDTIAGRMTRTQVPNYNTKTKHDWEDKSYYIEVKNMRTGYTKVMPRSKAFRYINNTPSLWSIQNPLVEFKDTYELVK